VKLYKYFLADVVLGSLNNNNVRDIGINHVISDNKSGIIF